MYTLDTVSPHAVAYKEPGDPANMPIYHVRRLMPVECERLQGLPDGWTQWDAQGGKLSDASRYRMIGNSVAVPVLTWIAERMRKAMEDPAEVHASEIREGNGQR